MPRRFGPPRPAHDAILVCPPGLEEVVVEELKALGVRRAHKDSKGAVAARLNARQLYAANAFLRSATRVYVNVHSFRAENFSMLERRLRDVDWAEWINPERTRMSLRVTSHSSALYHTGAIEERVRRSLPGSLRAFLSEPLEQRVLIRLERDVVSVRVDASGDPLHERGWRQETAAMPVRESVAAAVLRRSGWEPGAPLIDPCCGAGTLAIEAAVQSCGAPPHAPQRRFALHHWPRFEPGTWASVAGEAEERAAAATAAAAARGAPPLIVAADRDAGAVAAARANAARAGVEALIEFRHAPLSALAPPAALAPPGGGDGAGGMAGGGAAGGGARGTLVSNPPWGLRSGGGGAAETDLRALYAALGRRGRAALPGWGLALLVADRALARAAEPGLVSRLSMELGGVRAWLMARAPGGAGGHRAGSRSSASAGGRAKT